MLSQGQDSMCGQSSKFQVAESIAPAIEEESAETKLLLRLEAQECCQVLLLHQDDCGLEEEDIKNCVFDHMAMAKGGTVQCQSMSWLQDRCTKQDFGVGTACVEGWGAWSPCVDGDQFRVYEIISPAKDGGEECPLKPGEKQHQVCLAVTASTAKTSGAAETKTEYKTPTSAIVAIVGLSVGAAFFAVLFVGTFLQLRKVRSSPPDFEDGAAAML
eukprot:NODE_949_length_1357_cov_192.641437_g742_i1.p1 GENE.NODE_949_length_1357_cov_192.641437_g742_i1~~NODE_949_length_1357_cov_192.641437_g742_i1.p1  ORF type:complete len:215 (-),score=55.60 NODE_949_length_1357_cov_192.641437_g742_i1:213-857(-)